MSLALKIQLFMTAFALMLRPVAGQERIPWDGLPTAKVSAAVFGTFSNQASWNVDLDENTVGSVRPPRMNVDAMILKMLNDSVVPVFRQILSNSELEISWKESDYKKWKKKAVRIFEPDSDLYFRTELRIAGDNGTGGNFGGLDMQMTFRSLHRQWDVVFGYSFKTLDPSTVSKKEVGGLRTIMASMFSEAVKDWKAALKKDLRYPMRYLFVSFDTEGLDRKQRGFLEKSIFPCLYQQTDSLGFVRLSGSEFQVFYRLGRRDPAEKEEDYLRWYADVLQFAMGNSEKYPCDLSHGPLMNYRPLVDFSADERKITIHWNKPK